MGGGGSASARLATLLSVVALALLYSCPADGDGTSLPPVPSTPIAEEIQEKDPDILYKADMHEDAQSLFSRGDINNPYLFTFGVTSTRLIEELSAELTIIGDTDNDGKVEELHIRNMPLHSFFVSDVPVKNSAMLKQRMYVVNNDVLLSAWKDTTVNAISPAYKENDYIVGIGFTQYDLINYDEFYDALPEDITLRVRILYEEETLNEETGDAVKDTVVLKDAKVEVSKADRYKIYTWRDLQHMNYDLSGDYVVENDIIFPDVGHYGYKNFVPIGPIGIRPELAEETPIWKYQYNFQYAFKGTFDGNGHEIRGLYINYPHKSFIGLFGHTNNAIIKNITIYHRGIYSADSVGGLTGYLANSTVSNAHVYAENGAEIVGKVAFVGGLVGIAVGAKSSIVDSSAHTTVKALKAKVSTGQLVLQIVGGLVGSAKDGSTVSNSYATGDVYGAKTVGGLIGEISSHNRNKQEYFSGLYATGNVIGRENIGGLIGQVWGANSGAIFVEGYATGNVRGTTDIKNVKDAGGLIGEVHGTASITGYSTGHVEGCTNVGGLIGTTTWRWSGIMSVRGYSVGDVSGCNGVGGLIGSIGVYDHYGEKKAGTDAHAIVGYATGNVRGDGHDTRIGLLIGYIFDQNRGSFDGYTSTETRNVANANGLRGIQVAISQVNNNNYRGIFQDLTFGDEVGQWTWVGDGKWPALNLGDVAPAGEQPIE